MRSTDNLANWLARVLPAQRCPQPKAPMQPRQVVVLNVLAQDPPEVAFAGDQQPVQGLTTCGSDPSFANGVRLRRPVGRGHLAR